MESFCQENYGVWFKIMISKVYVRTYVRKVFVKKNVPRVLNVIRGLVKRNVSWVLDMRGELVKRKL